MIAPRLTLPALVALLVFSPRGTFGAGEGETFFESKVRPILAARCYECHSEEGGKRKGGLWLDRREGWQEGGESGPAIVPSNRDKSLLLRAVRYLDEDLQMPPKSRLPEEEIAVLEKWVAMGAPDPRDAVLGAAVRTVEIDYEAARRSWAFRPHTSPEPPAVSDPEWERDDLDSFVLAGLEERGLQPVGDAAPVDLLRRLHFDLNGLPPRPEEVRAFETDHSEEALARVVDDLLGRRAFGERWGRHWLDVARYADSNGGDRNFTYHQAWRYRNYVIDSFNSDRPYYEFVRQQLAGDVLPAENDAQRAEQLVASTFLALGPKMLTERDKEKLWMDTADEQADTVGRAFLGLTLGCARCHDHKFDPVSQEDYYALAGIFRSTQVVMGTRNGCVNVASWVEQPLPGPEPGRAELAAKVKRAETAMRLVVEKSFKKKAGGKMTPDKLPLAGVIYDNADAELIGAWKSSTLFPNRFGADYIHDDLKGKGEKRAVFRGSLPESGVYEVRIAYNANPKRASNVPITVEAWDGVQTVRLDQTKAPQVGGLFEPIGRFRFEKGGRVTVIIETGGTDSFVIVDAVQFVPVADLAREAAALAAMEDKEGDQLFRMNEGELKKELTKILKELRTADLAMAPREAADAGDVNLRVRGEVSQLGPVIARNFPQVLNPGPPPEIPDGQSGRRELAEWITSPANALLDRVMVNRIWHHLFGRGLVASVDNFGKLGVPPTHPELLDYLAGEFRASDGSVKGLVRRLVLSRSYRLGAEGGEALREADPENALLGRQNRRRLSAEEIRDSALFLAGRLSAEPGEATSGRYGEDLDKPMSFAKETLRTVYLPVPRNNLVAELEVFDGANPDLVSGNRPTTTVPTQALFLMNSDYFLARGREIAKRIVVTGAEPAEAIDRLYEVLLHRRPSQAERGRAAAFIQEIEQWEGAAGEGPDAFGHLTHLLLVSTEFLFLN